MSDSSTAPPTCGECGCLTGGGAFCWRHVAYVVTPKKDGSFIIDRNGDRKHVRIEPPRWADERYQRTRHKLTRQRKELRNLNRAIRIEKTVARAISDQRVFDIKRLQAQIEALKHPLDYRGVCQCWPCRVRQWWRFRTGVTYPGKAGWRFPWVQPRS